jgi:hypothetical protein
MAMTVQDWQEIEFKHKWQEIESRQEMREAEPGRQHTKPRKPVNPMIYPAILAILGVIGTLVMFVYAIRTANEHMPHRQSVNMMYEPRE